MKWLSARFFPNPVFSPVSTEKSARQGTLSCRIELLRLATATAARRSDWCICSAGPLGWRQSRPPSTRPQCGRRPLPPAGRLKNSKLCSCSLLSPGKSPFPKVKITTGKRSTSASATAPTACRRLLHLTNLKGWACVKTRTQAPGARLFVGPTGVGGLVMKSSQGKPNPRGFTQPPSGSPRLLNLTNIRTLPA